MSIEVRAYSREHERQIKPMAIQVLANIGAIYEKPDQWDRFGKDLSRIDEKYQGRSRFWVALDGERVVGTLGLLEEKGNQDTARLKRMFVDSEYQRKGIGEMLLGEALRFAMENEYREIVLKSGEKMHSGHNFWRKHGFKETGKTGRMLDFVRPLIPMT